MDFQSLNKQIGEKESWRGIQYCIAVLIPCPKTNGYSVVIK